MREIKLTQGKYAIVDDEDFNKLSEHKWHFSISGKKKGYAKRNNHGKSPALIRMHRIIMDAKKGQEIDHINGNTLDNRKENLRIVSRSQNMMNCGLRSTNTSGYKGVTYSKRDRKWLSKIWKDGKQFHIGFFKDKRDAAIAYNEMAKELFGEYVKLNSL